MLVPSLSAASGPACFPAVAVEGIERDIPPLKVLGDDLVRAATAEGASIETRYLLARQLVLADRIQRDVQQAERCAEARDRMRRDFDLLRGT